MKKILFSLPLILFCCCVRAADAGGPDAAAAATLKWFAGGMWSAPLPAGKDGVPMHLELRCTAPANGQGVRFESAFVHGDQPIPYTAGMYYWHPAKKQLAIFYTDASGSLTEGTITPEGDTLVHELTVSHANGTIEPVRVRLTKEGPDKFTNEIYVQKDGAWQKIVTVHYERKS